jgi:hypothetical protein
MACQDSRKISGVRRCSGRGSSLTLGEQSTMAPKNGPVSRAWWACTAILCFGIAGAAVWFVFDANAQGEIPDRGSAGRTIRKIGHEAEFDIATGKFVLVGAFFAAFGIHATFKACGRKGDEVLFSEE